MAALDAVAQWPVGTAAVAVIDHGGVRESVGPDVTLPWASVTKLLTSLSVLVGVAPTLVPDLVAGASRTAFPGLVGVLPGFGRQDPNDWGLGFEIRDGKRPHWTGQRSSPETFGHFGQSGSFLWIDPVAGIACACLTDTAFGEWAVRDWPVLSDLVLRESGRGVDLLGHVVGDE
jgi:Beta-lactamase